MNVKKIVVVAVVALAIYVVMRDPQGAAGGVGTVVAGLRSMAEGLMTFLQGLGR